MLWDHRRSLTRVQPFDGFDRVIRVIDSLDPASTRGFFFDYAFREPGDKKRPGQEWLDRARDFDRGARSLINYCISRGALEAGKPSQAWLNLAKALPDQDAEIKLLVRYVSTADEVDPTHILITHGPPAGVNEGPDAPHHGLKAVRRAVEWMHPRLLLHGHVHPYGRDMTRETQLGETRVINVVGHRMIELAPR